MLDPRIVLLRATASDLDLARQAIVEVNLPTSHNPPPFEDVALVEFLADPAHYLVIAAEDGKAVGSLYGYALRHPHRRDPQFFLYGIDVRPEYGNRGIGAALVESFVTEARRAKAFEVWVLTNEANRAAMAMYSHAGLKRCSADDVALVLPLTSGRSPENSGSPVVSGL
jgi:ribosomal protein S18 acetylase RimI-like enzyme